MFYFMRYYNILMDVEKELYKHKNSVKAKTMKRFFKKEDSDEDTFLGIYMGTLRLIAKKYQDISLIEVKQLLDSKYHEYRMVGLLILILKYKRGGDDKYVRFYLKNVSRVNAWDLVDASAGQILGRYVHEHPEKKSVLVRLAESGSVWSRRIAIVATFYFIKRKDYRLTISLAKKLMNDEHHYIQKGVGWMLKEIGNKNKGVLIDFLKKYYHRMPKVMSRYAMEKLTKEEKHKIVSG